MTMKNLIITVIATYIVMSIIGMGFEYYMSDQFPNFNALQRGAEDLKAHEHWMYIGYFLLTIVFCYMYTRCHEGKGWPEGMRFGLMVGLLFAFMDFTLYGFLPVTFMEVLTMMVMDVAIFVAGGITASLVYKAE